MRWGRSFRVLALSCVLGALNVPRLPMPLFAEDKIPLEHCDVLPVIPVRIGGAEMRFLLDTGATTILNLSSFSSGQSKDIKISSWRGTAATSAREVLIPELALGEHRLRNLKLPAVDLNPIGKACGGRIDGILGVDLLERMGATIDLQHRIAQFGASREPGAEQRVAAHNAEMGHCVDAFNQGRADELKDCFDPEIVLYTPWGDFHGRAQVVAYLQQRFFSLQPHPKFEIKTHDSRVVGDAVWQAYDYRIDSPDLHIAGRGMMVCRENSGRWQLLNMHNSIVQPEVSKGGKSAEPQSAR